MNNANESILIERDTRPPVLLVGYEGDQSGCASYLNLDLLRESLKYNLSDVEQFKEVMLVINQFSLEGIYGKQAPSLKDLSNFISKE